MDTAEIQKILDTEGDVAADYLEELLEIADLDGDIDIFTEGDRAHVSIVTDSDVLVGRDGEVLSALQELARLAVMTETGERSRLMLDVAGFREKRRAELQGLATEAIVEVKETGEPARLSAMNAFERKVVHDVVAAAGLVSESLPALAWSVSPKARSRTATSSSGRPTEWSSRPSWRKSSATVSR